MNYFVTGGCGFVGSHLVDRLIKIGRVIVYDNLSSGKKEYIKSHLKKDNFKFIKADLLDPQMLEKSIKGSEVVFHLAANPEIRIGEKSPKIDFQQGIIATYNLLEAMRRWQIKKIIFSSSSTVFGETAIRPTPENCGPMKPISVYGASKMASEGLISSYCYMFGMQSWIFRFANIIGKRSTHGILVDFINKLIKDRENLEVLGDGNQRKSYLLVEDCVEGMLCGFHGFKERVNICNLGTSDDVKVSQIAKILIEKSGLKGTKIRYTGGKRGWRGDVPLMLLDTRKIRKLGWRVKYNSKEAVQKAIEDLLKERKI